MKVHPLLIFALWLLCPSLSSADVIYLTDGSVLVVEKAWEKGDRVHYQTSSGSRSIPKSSVRRTQSQKAVPADPSRGTGSRFPRNRLPRVGGQGPSMAPPPQTGTGEVSEAILERLRKKVAVDPSDSNSRRQLLEALIAYASLRQLQGDTPGARQSLKQALSYDRKNLKTLMNLAFVDYQAGDYRASADRLHEVIALGSNNAYAHALLGEAYYAQDQLAQAIKHWETSLRLNPSEILRRRLEKARREAGTHAELGVLQSAHFILRYDRQVSDYHLGQEILHALERNYRRLARQLLPDPPATVAVILYPDQTYFDVTRAPRWSGALFDGKIRIPTKGLANVSDQLNAVLVHELTHSFLSTLDRSQLPTWLNEGIAQLQEGKSAESHKAFLRELYSRKQLIPLTDLRGSLAGLSGQTASLAYLQSLSSVEYLVSRHSRGSLRQILKLLRQNYGFEHALKTATGQGLAEFEKAWLNTLKP